VEAALGKIPVLLASQKTAKNLSTEIVIVIQVVAWAVSAIEGMTVGGTIPSLTATVAVAELAGLVYPRPILDALAAAAVVPAKVGLSRLFRRVYVN
jgi:hypothetical protein